ncbi:helix-turn-helix domain-containing protein [Actinoplanes utahensis]|uniref:MerR family transcriptional regulator n=2 Tax=Actinoplanes utahensis TaxID=1869 RepID=A0A0A6UIH7_ACTUT|nr:MerR family transcriptional regulator [Actinoplanes utahensis]KHD75890.1 MerR family transcriptional regulator [Actinoplanes utahensis]GIF34975.1 MerR family transcriptional regulator [Actinoplanes utahensis]
MTIGEFGRRTGLSIKALRLYEASGLLPPAEVEPSGYRRYTSVQLDRAGRISLLRRLGMPLAVIGDMLGLPDAEAVTRLDRWWSTEEAAIAARRDGYRWLRTRLAHGDEPDISYPVHTVLQPARKVATLRFETDQQGLVPGMGAAEWEIRRRLEEQGAATTGEHWAIYHGQVTPDCEAPVEVCVPFTGTAEPAGRLTIRMEPEHLVAFAEVTRDDCFYPRILQAYEAVETHVRTAGLIRTAPPREIYLDNWDRLTGADPFTHVAQPFEG